MHRVIPTHGLHRTAPGRRTVRLLCAGLFAIAAHPAAAAGPRAKALAAIEEGNLRDAKKYLETLDEYLASATKEIPPQAVGFRYQIEARYHQERGKDADALKALRQACLVHPGGKPNPKLLAYAATKGAIQNYTIGLAQLLGERKIRVNCVAPGPIWTPLIPSTMPAEKVESFGKTSPAGRPGQPGELAPVYVMLASDEASYVSGATVPVTGGMPFI